MKGTIRQRLTISVVSITAVMLALLVIGFNLTLRSSLDGDVDQLLEARAQTTLENVDFKDGNLQVGEGSDDGAEDALVWVFADGRQVEGPQISGRLDQIARRLANEGRGESTDDASDTRFYAEPIVVRGRAAGTVVTGISLEPYEKTADRALVASIVLALVMLVLIAITTRLVVDRALKPVSVMTEEAANWSEHDLDRRFNEGEPTDELTQLAATFDTMLDRMAYMVRHERNFSAELSHELRTPLSAIAAEAEIALRKDRPPDEYRDSLERISERSVELTGILETLLDVARAEGGAQSGETVDLDYAVGQAIVAADSLAERYGIRLEVGPDGEHLRVQVAPDTLQRMLAPIIENALTYARSSVAIGFGRKENGRAAEILVTDDGPGFDGEEAVAAFEPGRRGSAPRNAAAPAGTGLGLALSRRLARANGGEVSIMPSEEGAQVSLSVPLAIDPAPNPE